MISTLALVLLAPQSFSLERTITTGVHEPTLAIEGDFDGDGAVDVISAGRFSRELAIIIGRTIDASAQAAAPKTRAIATFDQEIGGVRPADFDGDGNLDLVVLLDRGDDALTGRLLFLRGTGDGGFLDAQTLAVRDGGDRMRAVDVDSDGDVDVIVPSAEGSASSRWPFLVENLGGGAFAPERPMLGTATRARSLEAADVDGDGRLDLIAAGMNGGTRWFQQTGVLDFSLTATLDASTSTSALVVRDLDADGDLDALLVNATSPIVLLEGLAAGTFAAPRAVPTATVSPNAIDVGDVTGDGTLDIIGATGTVRVYSQTAPLTFALPEALDSVAIGSVRVTDVTGDGRPDVLVGTTAGGGAGVFIGEATSSSLALRRTVDQLTYRVPAARFVRDADLDGDGGAEVLVGDVLGRLYVAKSAGLGRFDAPQQVLGLDPLRFVDAADFNGDGRDDLLMVDASNTLRWLPSLSSASAIAFGTPVSVGVTSAAPSRDLAIADFDGDGLVDLILARPLGAFGQVVVALQNPAGGFDAPAVVYSGASLVSIDAGDIDGDGILDLAGYSAASAGVVWVKGTAAGTLELQMPPVSTGGLIRDLVIADFSGIGPVDLIWSELGADEFRWSALQSNGSFAATGGLGVTTPNPGQVLAGRTGAQPQDSLFLTWGAGQVPTSSLRLERQGASFVPTFDVPSSADVRDLHLADLDGDGDLDLLRASRGNSEVSWFRNDARNDEGTNYCGPAVLNASGASATIEATGSVVAMEDDLTLLADRLPEGSLTMFLVSRAGAFVPQPGGSVGNLCLGGTIGRFVRAGEFGAASSFGQRVLRVPLMDLPQAGASAVGVAGELWRFQAWFRDSDGGGATSNFTDAVAVVLR